ncbi:MAG TPA: DNA recombination protein RmuC [Mycobacteriales bacterium]|jgi:DNA recombination protein RmuC|nr:DNA recombination protein RmuC [Mycobacteriales bacterium]
MDVAAVATATLLAGAFIGAGVARAATRSRVSEATATAQTERAAAVAERDSVRAERDQLRAERDVASQQLQVTSARLVEAQTLLKSQEQVEAQLTQSFARMSNETLQATHQQLLNLADDRFRLAGKPLNETLAKVETQLREIEQKRGEAQAALTEQIGFVRVAGEQLRSETASLVGALRKPQARGRWGELQLKRCVELAGMTDRCDFVEQETLATSDGVLRPDMIIRLVGGKNIVIDSKVTLAAYLEAYEAGDGAVRDERLAAHARHLRQHVDALAAKAYWAQLSPAPEFVVLFVPGDSFLAAALDQDPALLDYAFDKKVHIASPTTLISVLRTVAYVWQQEALAKNAQAVFDLGKELYQRLGKFGGHMSKLGNSLTSAVKVYNESVGSLERNVLSSARKLNDLEIVDEPIKELTGIEETVRPLARAELVESVEVDRTIRAVTSVVDDLDRLEDYGINITPDRADDWRTGS